jgi:hypothetical protein
LKTIFLDGLAGRLPVFLRNGEKSQNGNSNIDVTEEEGTETTRVVNTA